MKKFLAFMLVLVCVFSLVACSGKPIIVSIRDHSKQENLGFAAVLEPFYEDENAVYSFPYPISTFIIVTYLNGESEDIITALESGRATVSDLDKFGIDYYTEPKK